MIFSSFPFLLVFLPLALIGFVLARRVGQRSTTCFLLVASWVFYAFWDWRYLPLLWLSMGVNYALGLRAWQTRQKTWLVAALVFNLGMLGYYKYLGFFAGMLGYRVGDWVLPLAISFYTFQQIAWHVDLYRQRLQAPGRFDDFMLCVSFFPHLVAGPICRPASILPQIERGWNARAWAWDAGLALFAVGLAKKVLLADSIAPGVDALYARVPTHGAEVLLAGAGYGVQLYFDFSGYADMAIGLGLLFGVKLPINFRSPYRATSIVDFWRHWHISLSRFLRDYLYVPLGGARRGRARQALNLMLTMVLGGLWHGAGWQFLLWGVLHGAFLCINHVWRRALQWSLPAPVGWALTMLAVMLAWVPFRARDMDHTVQIFGGLATWQVPAWPAFDAVWMEVARLTVVQGLWFAVPALLLAAVVVPRSQRIVLALSPSMRGMLTAVLLLLACKALVARPDRAFLYFNF